MNGINGHAYVYSNSSANDSGGPLDLFAVPAAERFSTEKAKQLVAELEVPFESSVIEWRVTNTAQDGKRGQILPYADPRAYTDRLNCSFTPCGWTRRYTVNTSASFERAKDKKIAAKILVTCELTIFGLGSHSATGEEFADSQFALTAAEAQSFKRAASCFGLGRYLYYFTGMWVDLDERKRPMSVPQLFGWATPQGWREGLRPNSIQADSNGKNGQPRANSSQIQSLIPDIEAMAKPLGRGLYRGILRDLARVWNPREIHEIAIQQKVLEHMRAAERGLHRLEAALEQTEPDTLSGVLRNFGFRSLERVNTLEMLKRVVLAVEGHAPKSEI
ncbi:MAG TPA: Rad52/Rad22 family DNA repair protein [Terriglobales bacterium]|nr:Rad52/Rad22 family DNA repair protein [Terriglobales bacterium]